MIWVSNTSTMPSVSMAPRLLPRIGFVLHATAGSSSLSWLQRSELIPARKSSADWLCDRSGLLHRLTPIGMYAFHSGRADWNGYQEADGSINQGFIGVEIENLNDGRDAYTDEQLVAVAALVRYGIQSIGISPRMVAGHFEVCIPPGRKTDPANFPWRVFWDEVVQASPGAPSFAGVSL